MHHKNIILYTVPHLVQVSVLYRRRKKACDRTYCCLGDKVLNGSRRGHQSGYLNRMLSFTAPQLILVLQSLSSTLFMFQSLGHGGLWLLCGRLKWSLLCTRLKRPVFWTKKTELPLWCDQRTVTYYCGKKDTKKKKTSKMTISELSVDWNIEKTIANGSVRGACLVRFTQFAMKKDRRDVHANKWLSCHYNTTKVEQHIIVKKEMFMMTISDYSIQTLCSWFNQRTSGLMMVGTVWGHWVQHAKNCARGQNRNHLHFTFYVVYTDNESSWGKWCAEMYFLGWGCRFDLESVEAITMGNCPGTLFLNYTCII